MMFITFWGNSCCVYETALQADGKWDRRSSITSKLKKKTTCEADFPNWSIICPSF